MRALRHLGGTLVPMRRCGVRRGRLSVAALGFAGLLWAGPARADPPRIETPGNAFAPAGDDQGEAVIAYVLGRADTWGWRGALETGLTLEAHVTASRATPSLRLWTITGRFGSLPVDGELAHVLVDDEDHGRIRVVTHRGALGALDDAELDDPLQAASVVTGSGLPGSEGPAEAVPIVWPADQASHPGWLIDPPPDLLAGTNPSFYVSAGLDVVSAVRDGARAGTGRIFAIDPQTTPETALVTLGNLEDGASFLDGLVFSASNCVEPEGGEYLCVEGQVATADALGDFVFDAPDWVFDEGQMGDAFSEVNAYAHADAMALWLEEHGLSQLACGRGSPVGHITTNFARYDDVGVMLDEGGLYTGACESLIVLHQGERDAAWDATVVRHEVAHAAIETVSSDGLATGEGRSVGFVREAEAINEGVADFLAAASLGWPVVGSYAFPASARNLELELSCPRDLVGDPHADGMILSAALWAAYSELGEPFVVALLDTLSMMAADASWIELTNVLRVVVARELGEFAVPVVLAAFADHGIGCSRVVAWEDLASATTKAGHAPASFVVEAMADSRELVTPYRPGSFQIRIDPPPGVESVDFGFEVEGADPADLSVFVRYGAEVEFSFMETGPGISTVEATYIDHASLDATALRVSGERGPIYLALANASPGWPNAGDAVVRLGNLEFIETDEEETGGDDDGAGEGSGDGLADGGTSSTSDPGSDDLGELDGSLGCACSSQPNHRSGFGQASLLILLWGFASGRRRKRS